MYYKVDERGYRSLDYSLYQTRSSVKHGPDHLVGSGSGRPDHGKENGNYCLGFRVYIRVI